MKTYFNVFFAFCICALLCTCKKDRQELPAITSKGANTFGCLLNGKPIIFTNPKHIYGGIKSEADTSFNWLPRDSSDMWLVFENGKHTVNLFLNNPLVTSQWSLNKNTLVYPITIKPKDYIMVDGFISSSDTKGEFVSSSLSKTEPIFCGTFEFECINPRTCQTMKVTNGRLDLDLRSLQ